MGCQNIVQLLLRFLLIALLTSLSSAVDHHILYSICSQTQSEEACVELLERDPRTNSCSLQLLSLIATNFTREQAQKNYKIFRNLQANTTTGSLRRSYGNCMTIYQKMIGKINEAYLLSQKGKYKDIPQLGQAQDLAYDCENGLPSNSTTAADTQTMILSCESSWSVNLYIAIYSPAS